MGFTIDHSDREWVVRSMYDEGVERFHVVEILQRPFCVRLEIGIWRKTYEKGLISRNTRDRGRYECALRCFVIAAIRSMSMLSASEEGIFVVVRVCSESAPLLMGVTDVLGCMACEGG